MMNTATVSTHSQLLIRRLPVPNEGTGAFVRQAMKDEQGHNGRTKNGVSCDSWKTKIFSGNDVLFTLLDLAGGGEGGAGRQEGR